MDRPGLGVMRGSVVVCVLCLGGVQRPWEGGLNRLYPSESRSYIGAAGGRRLGDYPEGRWAWLAGGEHSSGPSSGSTGPSYKLSLPANQDVRPRDEELGEEERWGECVLLWGEREPQVRGVIVGRCVGPCGMGVWAASPPPPTHSR